MHVTIPITTFILLASSTIAAPLESRQSTLNPWQLDSLSTFSPSGRPGNYPWLTITASLTDPNTVNLGTSPNDNSTVTVPSGAQALNCEAKWIYGEKPFGRSWPCDNSGLAQGWWTLEIEETDDFSVAKFDAKFTRVAEVSYQGSSYRKDYEGSAHFEVGDNLGGQCGGSGVCSWQLKGELAPYDVQQQEIDAE